MTQSDSIKWSPLKSYKTTMSATTMHSDKVKVLHDDSGSAPELGL